MSSDNRNQFIDALRAFAVLVDSLSFVGTLVYLMVDPVIVNSEDGNSLLYL